MVTKENRNKFFKATLEPVEGGLVVEGDPYTLDDPMLHKMIFSPLPQGEKKTFLIEIRDDGVVVYYPVYLR